MWLNLFDKDPTILFKDVCVMKNLHPKGNEKLPHLTPRIYNQNAVVVDEVNVRRIHDNTGFKCLTQIPAFTFSFKCPAQLFCERICIYRLVKEAIDITTFIRSR